MSDKNYYKETEEAFRRKREARESDRRARLEQVHITVPQLVEIDAALAKTGYKIMGGLREGADVKEMTAAIKAENESLRQRRRELLKKNGYPEDYTDVKYDCEKCGDSGFVNLDMCSCMIKAVADARLADSDLGRLSETQNFESFDLTYYAEGAERATAYTIYEKLYSYAKDFNSKTEQGWLLLGGTGLGKTHLSTAVGIEVIKRGYDVEYKTVQSLLDDFQAVQFRGGDVRGVDKYYDCDLLIVDDLGAEMSTQFTVSCIYNLINTRMNKRKPTIFSTNLSADEIRDRYGDRIVSRLLGEYQPLRFVGKDIRHQRLCRRRGKI
ncbi:MAG: ATP-binding protein [Clostridia bacterium]|nr:ATP-binding protein [Clostridia bacterium]